MEQNNSEEEDFKPTGAMAFFVVLLAFFVIVWFTLYFQLLGGA